MGQNSKHRACFIVSKTSEPNMVKSMHDRSWEYFNKNEILWSYNLGEII